MPLITDYDEVRGIYTEAAERGIGLPVFCAEDRETLEGILASAYEFGKRIGVDSLPIIPAWTGRYPSRGQAGFVSACGDPVLGCRLMFSDLACFAGENSPYRNLRIMPHFDHAIPWLDMDLMLGFADQFASIMCDASEKPFDENMETTKQYVEDVRGRVVVEGAVDEIFEDGGEGEKNDPTTAEQAQRYLEQTGVDIVVPNVGTEHRATAKQVRYLSEQARAISAVVGKIMCLHGTSSLKDEDLGRLPDDGFVKINVYTTLAVHGGQALARSLLGDVGNLFGEDDLRDLVDRGVLGPAVLAEDYAETRAPIQPKLNGLCNPTRRDAWFKAVRDRCTDYLSAFHYERYQG